MKYFRIHSNEITIKTQQPRGLFVAIWDLVEKNILTDNEVREYWTNRKWFEEYLPIPPFYDDGNTVKAVTWYKNNSHGNGMFEKMTFYFRMAEKYNVPLYKSESDVEPGKVIYEDDFQIGVVECEKYKDCIRINKYSA